VDGNKIKAKVEVDDFLKILRKYGRDKVECTEHTFFRLDEAQRKIYTCEKITEILFQTRPFLVGEQFNSNYAIFFKYNKKVLKCIISLKNNKVNIVTFYFILEWQIPTI